MTFEPVGIEMEIEESETVLDAAFRQGLMLMHGCKEGQCSACKSFLLDGETDMGKYSTFALPDFEREEGYVLLCKTHVYSDATIELVNFDEESLRASNPIREAQTEVVAVESLTHDIRRLEVKLVSPERLPFAAGQYVDVKIPGCAEHRAFSMANTPETCDRLEFIIKLYPQGRFSSLLDGELKAGDALDVKGPYGTCTLRSSSNRDLILVGGGAGMAPLWSLINAVAERDPKRKVTFYYGARSARDLFYLAELEALVPACRLFTASSRFPSRRRRSHGTARPASSPMLWDGSRTTLWTATRTCADHRPWSTRHSRYSLPRALPKTESSTISSR